MPDRRDRLSRSLGRRNFIALLGGTAFGAAFLAACGGGGGPNAATTSGGTRAITDGKGTKVVVPTNPKRLVVLGSTIMDLLAMGVVPVAARNISRDKRMHPEVLAQGSFEGVVDLGGQDLDLELVLTLQPDLILADTNQDQYDRLSKIAPMPLYDRTRFVDHWSQWKDRMSFYAEALNKREDEQRLLKEYEACLAEFKSRMSARSLQDTVVSVVGSSNNGIRLITASGFAGSVLIEAGVRRPPSQQLDAAQTLAANEGSDAGILPISLERLREADGDVLILYTSSSAAPTGNETQVQTTKAKTDALKADPIWGSLNAVRQGRVYEVGGYWGGRTIVDANKVVDDLFRAVLKEAPSAPFKLVT